MGAVPDPDHPDKVTRGDVVFYVAFVLFLVIAAWLSDKFPA